MRLTKEQMDNLKKLQSYLRGELKARFDMFYYSDDPSKPTKNCGSVGCAVGHGPYAGVEKHFNEDWTDYGDRCFGSHTSLWLFLFDCIWVLYDNTPEGVVKRIQYVFDHGVPLIKSVREGHQLMEKYNAIN